jgi:hypothetical protein
MEILTLDREIEQAGTTLTERELYRLGLKRWMEVCELFCEQLGFDVAQPQEDSMEFLLKMKGEETVLRYAKCYKSWKHEITAKELSELGEQMGARGIENGIIFTRGSFSKEALEFVKGKSFDLITIRGLLKDILLMKDEPIQAIEALAREFRLTAPLCPGCGRVMNHAKNQVGGYWRCANYPKCNLTYMK